MTGRPRPQMSHLRRTSPSSAVPLMAVTQDAEPPVGGPGVDGLFPGSKCPSLPSAADDVTKQLDGWSFPESQRSAFAEGAGVCVGVTVAPGAPEVPIISNYTLRFATEVKQFWKAMRRMASCPTRRVSSLQVSKNAVFKRHADSNNRGPSYFAKCGSHTGGELMSASTSPPQALDATDKFAEFDGHDEHWSLPFVGTRYSITAFYHQAADKLTPTQTATLQDLGFPIGDHPPRIKQAQPPKPRQLPGLQPPTKLGLPERVMVAKRNATSLDHYRDLRVFHFLHHYSGASPEGLEFYIRREAEKRELQVKVTSRDKLINNCDLTLEQPFGEDWECMLDGTYDGYHSGFDCSTWSRARFQQRADLPTSAAPLRSRSHLLGLPANRPVEQERTDNATTMATRSFNFARTMIERGRARGLRLPVTIEQPEIPEDVEDAPSAFFLEEAQILLADEWVDVAEFHSCRYGSRSLKAQMWVGSWVDIREMMSGQCQCPADTQHVTLLGGPLTSAAGTYPTELLQHAASIICDTWEDMLEAEWAQPMVDLQPMKWIKRGRWQNQLVKSSMVPTTTTTTGWQPNAEKRTHSSQRAARLEENEAYIWWYAQPEPLCQNGAGIASGWGLGSASVRQLGWRLW